MNTPEQIVIALADYLACHQQWGQAVKPKAIVFVCGESNGLKLPPFYTPHFGWQDLSLSPAAIALFLVEGQDWQSADPNRSVDGMLLAIKRTGRGALLIGNGQPIPTQVSEMGERLKRALQTENYVWN